MKKLYVNLLLLEAFSKTHWIIETLSFFKNTQERHRISPSNLKNAESFQFYPLI